jgi:predicted RNA-binding protein with RPS1 domain
MKKITIFLTALFLFSLNSQAQSFGEMEWQKKKIPAVLTEVPQSVSVTEDAIKQKLSQLGYNGKETKGVYVFKAIRIPEISDETFDVLLSIERKSRKEKDASIVYFAVSRGYENYVKADDDPVLVSKIKQYCLNFLPWAEAQALEVDIKNQEDKVKSSEKKLQDYQDDSESLQKKLKKLQDDIEENKKNIEKQKTEVENQRKALEILKGKRKS